MSEFDDQALQRLCDSIQKDIDNGQIYGASIVLAQHGKVGLQRTFGASSPSGRPTSEDDLYLMMSLSKSFTATLTLRAIDQGRFSLDTKVVDILPEFGTGGKQNVTIRHLLTHTAGTFSSFNPPGITTEDLHDLEKTVGALSALPAEFVPGQRCHYNPFASYTILGQILVVTDPAKRCFRDIAKEDLFLPLGMKDTEFGIASENPRRVPIAHTPMHTKPSTAFWQKYLTAATVDGSEFPAGGCYSTAQDVFRFAEVMRQNGNNGQHRLISPPLLDYACKNHTGSLSNDFWDFEKATHGIQDYPALFSLLGGYVRGEGHYLTGAGLTASPRAFYAVGGGSTMWMVDPERDVTFIFLSCGFIEGLAHFKRLQRLSDLALAACN